MATAKVFSRSIKRLLANRTFDVDLSLKHSVWTIDNIVQSPLRNVEIPNRTVSEHIWENLERWADKTALICGVTNHSITYHQLYKYSRRFGAQLRTKFKISDGDVVCIMMGNRPEYATAVLGAQEAGAEVTTVNPVYTSYEVGRQIKLSNPKVIIGVPESVPILKEALLQANMAIPIITCHLNETLPPGTISYTELVEDNHVDFDVLKEVHKTSSDVTLLPYSSGTTGLPKGVELTNRNLVANCVQQDVDEIKYYDETTSSHQESVIAVLPFFHIYGLSVVMLHKLSIGAKIVTIPTFVPSNFGEVLKQHKISLFHAAPPIILFLGSHPSIKSENLKTVKILTSGAAPLPKADIDKVLEISKTTEVLQLYGLTETSPLVTGNKKGSESYTSAGLAISNTELRIVDSNEKVLGPNEVGELHIRGPQVMKGYRNNPDATKKCITEDLWFKSGDLATIDKDGILTIADRLKELIKVKGYQVPPAELESVLKEHPDVLDAGVIGVPDQRSGEVPKAFVVLKDGHITQAKDIEDFVAERVAKYKRIKEVKFLDSLPKSPSGKLLRRVLREKYC